MAGPTYLRGVVCTLAVMYEEASGLTLEELRRSRACGATATATSQRFHCSPYPIVSPRGYDSCVSAGYLVSSGGP
eukprot:7584813-Pyramimonas_sp.AAC.1